METQAMTLDQWRARWQIPQACFDELLQTAVLDVESKVESSESRVQSLVRLEAPRYGVHLFRNNVGAGAIIDPDELCPKCKPHASHIRWGLANDSKRINSQYKSGDLIGGRSFIIQPEHVGCRVLQFVSRECKREGYKVKGTGRDEAQLRWATFINSLGGDAKIVNGEGSF